MSCVRAGDFYRFLDMVVLGFKVGACFLCKQGPTIDTRYSDEHPTIHMGVAEIQQAAPTVDATPRLPEPVREEWPLLPSHMYTREHIEEGEVRGFRPPRSGLFDDSAEDVEFKEK